MAINRHAVWHVAYRLNRLLEEPLGAIPIQVLADSDIHEIAVMIKGTIEVLPHATNTDVRFVDKRRATVSCVNLRRRSGTISAKSRRLLCSAGDAEG